MFTVTAEQLADKRAKGCHVARCTAAATHTPVLCITLLGSEHVSRVPLPMRLCPDHRGTFAERFLTHANRARMEASLLSHGRNSPDWARTRMDFVND